MRLMLLCHSIAQIDWMTRNHRTTTCWAHQLCLQINAAVRTRTSIWVVGSLPSVSLTWTWFRSFPQVYSRRIFIYSKGDGFKVADPVVQIYDQSDNTVIWTKVSLPSSSGRRQQFERAWRTVVGPMTSPQEPHLTEYITKDEPQYASNASATLFVDPVHNRNTNNRYLMCKQLEFHVPTFISKFSEYVSPLFHWYDSSSLCVEFSYGCCVVMFATS